MTRAASARSSAWLRVLLLALSLWSAAAAAGETEVIVNGDHASITVDRDMLRAIFTTRLRQWPDGKPIRIFVMPDDSIVHDQFCREQLGMYPYVLRELWDRLLFTGTGLPPTVVRSDEEMRATVRNTPGAIGYVSTAGAKSNTNPTLPSPRKDGGKEHP
jgi:ABC-type phosphate transport system substrate-binding protein